MARYLWDCVKNAPQIFRTKHGLKWFDVDLDEFVEPIRKTMKKYVQHKSGQGEKFEVWAYNDTWRAIRSDGADYILPKSEYISCDPSEEWEDVTHDYISNGLVIGLKSQLEYYVIGKHDLIRKIDGPHNGPCFIVERKKS